MAPVSAPEQPYWAPWVGTAWIPCQPWSSPAGHHGQDHGPPQVSHGAALLGAVGRTTCPRVSPGAGLLGTGSRTVWIPWSAPGSSPTGCRGQDRVDPVSALEQPRWALWPGPLCGPCVSPGAALLGAVGRTAWPHVSPGAGPLRAAVGSALGWDTAGLSLGTLDCGPSNLVFLSKPS